MFSRLVGLGIALLLAIVGQMVISGVFLASVAQETRLVLGAILFVIAGGLFGWSAPGMGPWLGSSAPDEGTPMKWIGYTERVLFTAALVVYAVSMLIYVTAGESWLVRLLWVVGILLYIGAFVDFGALRRWRPSSLSREDGWDIVLLVLVTAAAFALRFWRLTEIPSYVHPDIASQGLQALEILRNNTPAWFGVGWSNIPNFDFVMMTWAMRLFGQTPFGLSMTAVIQGVLTIPAIYLLGREMFGRRVGALAAVLLAISYTHIQFSRIVTTASPLLIICLTLFALFRGLRLRSMLWFAVAGVSLGIGLLVYYPIRISVIVLVVSFVWLLIWQRGKARIWLNDGLVLGLGSLLGFGPMMGFVMLHFRDFVGRGSEVTLANPTVMTHLVNKYAAGSVTEVWVEQFKRTFLTFFFFGDSSTHFAFPGPMVDALTAVLLILGTGYAVWRLRDPRFFALLVWVVTTLVLGGVVTNDPPFWPHIVIVLPAVMVLAGVGGDRLWEGIVGVLPATAQRRAGYVLVTLVGVCVITAGVLGWQRYVGWVGDNADSGVRVARFASLTTDDRRFIILRDPLTVEDRQFQFYGHGLESADMDAGEVGFGSPLKSNRPTVFIITPNHDGILPELQRQYPGGVVAEHRATEGRLAFSSYEVTPPGYTPSAEVNDRAKALALRITAVWVAAAILFGAAMAAGLWLFIRRKGYPEVIPATAAAQSQITTLPINAKVQVAGTTADSATLMSKNCPKVVSANVETDLEETKLTKRQATFAVGGMALALALACLGQHFYDFNTSSRVMQAIIALGFEATPRSMLWAGTVLYVAAMVVFALSAPGLPVLVAATAKFVAGGLAPRKRNYPGELPPDARIHWQGSQQARAVAPAASSGAEMTPDLRRHLILLLAALVPYALSLVMFRQQGENAAVRWLWVLGLLLFIAGQVIWPWFRREKGAGSESSPRFRRHHVVILIVVLLAAFWLRFNQLDTVPHDLHGDMASMGIQAREWLASADRPLFREGWANIPIKGFLPAAAGLVIFGDSLFGLNMSAVIAGMLTLVGLYLLAWRLFDSHRLAILAVAILAVNTPHIHFSRLAAYMDPWPFLIFGTVLVVDGLRGRRPASLGLAGVLFGLGFEMYYSGRVAAVVMVVALLYLLLTRRDWLKGSGPGFALLIVGVFMTLGPSLLYFAENREPFLERSRAVWLFYEPVMTHLKGKYGLQTPFQVLLEQARLSLLMFNKSIDSSTQFGYPHPMFSSLLSPLVVLGFGYSLRRWRHPGVGLNLAWLLVILVNGSILTGDAPFWPRLVGILPAAAILAALVLDRLWATVPQALPSMRTRTVDTALGVCAAVLIAFAGWQNWALYVESVRSNARSQALIGRYLQTLPKEVAACDFTDPMALEIRETQFLAYPRRLMDLPPDAPKGLIERCPGPPFVWILYPNHQARLAELRTRWPDGVVQEHQADDGALIFTSYLVAEGVPDPFLAADQAGSPMTAGTQEPGASPPTVGGEVGGSTAYLPDGSTFQPEFSHLGDTTSSVWEIDAGQHTVSGGRFSLHFGPMAGHDAVVDYVELRGPAGTISRFEAEDPALTSGDVFTSNEGPDGHWWLQAFEPFSARAALVAQKTEAVPVITLRGEAPDGTYDVIVGSFRGDEDNGPFALGMTWNSP